MTFNGKIIEGAVVLKQGVVSVSSTHKFSTEVCMMIPSEFDGRLAIIESLDAFCRAADNRQYVKRICVVAFLMTAHIVCCFNSGYKTSGLDGF